MDNLLTIIKERRSIRRYQNRQIPKYDLEKIIEAGLYAPNAGGGQRSKIVAIHNKDLVEQLGKMNIANFNRSNLIGSYVNAEQPSIIDDPTITSGFYGAPTVCAIFTPKKFLYGIPDAFCCAQNMVLEAYELGISSCIIARAEETFDNPLGEQLLKDWNISKDMVARCFVLLGYCDGDYPLPKERKENRSLIIE